MNARLSIVPFAVHARLSLPLLLSAVAAGFPSPAEDYIDKKLDLNEHLFGVDLSHLKESRFAMKV